MTTDSMRPVPLICYSNLPNTTPWPTITLLGWQTARLRGEVELEGELMLIEPVDVARHAGQLFAAQSSAPELWEYLPYGPFESESDFRGWLTERAANSEPLFYAIIERI